MDLLQQVSRHRPAKKRFTPVFFGAKKGAMECSKPRQHVKIHGVGVRASYGSPIPVWKSHRLQQLALIIGYTLLLSMSRQLLNLRTTTGRAELL